MNRIREIRTGKKMSQDKLGEKIGVERAFVSRLENGKASLTQQYMQKIADALGCNPWDLVENNSPEVPKPKEDIDEIQIPIYGTVAGANERYSINDKDMPVEWVPRPHCLHRVNGAFGLMVMGDSMEPRYENGEMAFVHPHKKPLRNKDCVIEFINGEGVIKRFLQEDKETVTVKQFNPEKEIVYKKSEIKAVYAVVR